MTYYTIEERPKFQPGACFITGKHEDDYFIRLQCADAIFQSVLISSTGFDQLARDLGYAPKDAKINLLESLKEIVSELGPAYSRLVDDLRVVKSSVAPFEEVLRRCEDLGERLDEVIGNLGENAVEPLGAANPTLEPVGGPLMAGILDAPKQRNRRTSDAEGES